MIHTEGTSSFLRYRKEPAAIVKNVHMLHFILALQFVHSTNTIK